MYLAVVVQLLSYTQLFATPWAAVHQAFLSFTILRILLKLMTIELVMLSNHLIPCHHLLPLSTILQCKKYRQFCVSLYIFKIAV